MDINTIRGLATLVALVAFLSVVFWAYSSKRKGDFDEAASLPFADDLKEDAHDAVDAVDAVDTGDAGATNSHRENHHGSRSESTIKNPPGKEE